MIRLKSIMTEQPGATIKAKPLTASDKQNLKSAIVSPFNAKKVAELIYNAKGYFLDDERFAISVIEKNIKNIQQYTQVTKELQKLTGGSGLGAYLGSFMKLDDRLDVANHLMDVLPKTQWEWTIKQIIPWEDFKYLSSGDNRYTKSGAAGTMPQTAGQSNAATKIIQLYSKEWAGRRTELYNEWMHDMLYLGSAAASFVPVAGPYLAAMILSIDAQRYIEENNPVGAGVSLTFAALPFIGKVVQRIPIVRKFTEAQLARIGNLVAKISQNKSLTAAQRQAQFKKLFKTKDEITLVQEFSKHKDFILSAVEGPLQTWKAILKDPKLQALKKSLSPEDWKSLHTGIMNGKYKYEDVKQIATKYFASKGLGIEVALKFSPEELQSLNSIATDVVNQMQQGKTAIQNLYNKTYVIKNAQVRNLGNVSAKLTRNPKNPTQSYIKRTYQDPAVVTKNINVNIISDAEATRLDPDTKARAWAGWDGDIYMVLDRFKDEYGKVNQQEFRTVLTHELAHIKDPALVRSPKLSSTYNPRAGKAWTDVPDVKNPKQNFFKNYYFHDWETAAIRPQVLEQIIDGTMKFSKKVGRKKTLKILDDALMYFKTRDNIYWTNDVNALIFGDYASAAGTNHSVITFFHFLGQKDPKHWKNLVKTVTKQLTKTKTEVAKIPGIKENTIKLKNLL